jgi:formamidopyrimidine-DNA glycosylase
MLRQTGVMPELPEVQALAETLARRAGGTVIGRVDVAAISVLKTFDPPIDALAGKRVEAVRRHGKFLDVVTAPADGRDEQGGPGGAGADLHLVVHLARAGWLRWREELPPAPPRPGKGPLALRVRLDTGGGFELTEAGTQKRLAAYVVRDPRDVPGIARLGPDPLAPAFGRDTLAAILAKAGRAQLKGVLRDQANLAGVGNAYSDEVLHAARLSPYKPAGSLAEAEQDRLYDALRDTLGDAVERARALDPANLKDGKRLAMRVHGRAREECPVCGDTVYEVSFADSALAYCPTCQTGGRTLADRRLSRLLK